MFIPHSFSNFPILSACFAALFWVAPVSAFASLVFINEIHYDNSGADVGEAVEIAGVAGTDLSGWRLLLYNGNDGKPYQVKPLTGILPDQQNGFGTLAFAATGIQNGAPDGLALVDEGDNVFEFLSYEGAFIATEGPAMGRSSTHLKVFETADTPVGFSLQLSGNGSNSGSFTWADPQQHTFGQVNIGQTIIPVPAALPLLFSAISTIGFFLRGSGST